MHALPIITNVCGFICVGYLVAGWFRPENGAGPTPSAGASSTAIAAGPSHEIVYTNPQAGRTGTAIEQPPEPGLTRCALIMGGHDNSTALSYSAICAGYHTIIGRTAPEPGEPWRPDGIHPWPFKHGQCVACLEHATSGLWLGGSRMALCYKHVAKLKEALRITP